jgi:hypothetical protein
METNKLLALVLVSFVGCGLDTAGTGELTDESQMDADAVEPDADVSEDVFEDGSAEDAEPEDFGEDETAEDVVDVEADVSEDIPDADTAEDAEPEDFVEDEAGDEAGDEADGEETDDGGIVDPCAPPEIPPTGLYVFFCFDDDITSNIVMWRWVDRTFGPDISWEIEPRCWVGTSRSLFCSVEIYGGATYYCNFKVDPGINPDSGDWTCGPGLSTPVGAPLAWYNGDPLTVTSVANGSGGCNHAFVVPPI